MSEKKWVYNGEEFNVGDIVQVAFIEYEHENKMGDGEDWENVWVDEMNFALGGIFEIAEIRQEGVEFVDYVEHVPLGQPVAMFQHLGYLYPLSSLVKGRKE